MENLVQMTYLLQEILMDTAHTPHQQLLATWLAWQTCMASAPGQPAAASRLPELRCTKYVGQMVATMRTFLQHLMMQLPMASTSYPFHLDHQIRTSISTIQLPLELFMQWETEYWPRLRLVMTALPVQLLQMLHLGLFLWLQALLIENFPLKSN